MTNVVSLRAPQAPPDPEAEFAEFWAAYPRHEAMKEARAAYKRARKLVTAETLLAGARQHAEQYEPEFATMAYKWLRGERWNDEPVKGKARSTAAVGSTATDELVWRLRLRTYVKDKFWMPFWGDPPDHASCAAPHDLLTELGFRK